MVTHMLVHKLNYIIDKAHDLFRVTSKNMYFVTGHTCKFKELRLLRQTIEKMYHHIKSTSQSVIYIYIYIYLLTISFCWILESSIQNPQVSGGRRKFLTSIEVLTLVVEPKGFAGISKVNTDRDSSNLMEHWPFITVAHFSIILRGKEVRDSLVHLRAWSMLGAKK